MQMPRGRRSACQPRLPFRDPSEAELWTRLNLDQQQTCQELLSQLLQQSLHDPNGADQRQEGRDDDERQTSG